MDLLTLLCVLTIFVSFFGYVAHLLVTEGYLG